MTPTATAAISVVVVEDHPTQRALLVALLTDAGIRVLAAVGTLHDAHHVVTTLQPDVAVIDSRLPDGRGIDLCRILVSQAPGVSAIIHAGAATADDEREARHAGAAAVVLKTIRGRTLLDAIHNHAGPTQARPDGDSPW